MDNIELDFTVKLEITVDEINGDQVVLSAEASHSNNEKVPFRSSKSWVLKEKEILLIDLPTSISVPGSGNSTASINEKSLLAKIFRKGKTKYPFNRNQALKMMIDGHRMESSAIDQSLTPGQAGYYFFDQETLSFHLRTENGDVYGMTSDCEEWRLYSPIAYEWQWIVQDVGTKENKLTDGFHETDLSVRDNYKVKSWDIIAKAHWTKRRKQ